MLLLMEITLRIRKGTFVINRGSDITYQNTHVIPNYLLSSHTISTPPPPLVICLKASSEKMRREDQKMRREDEKRRSEDEERRSEDEERR